MYMWIACLILAASFGGTYGSATEEGTAETQFGQYHVIGGVLLLIGMVALVALCAEVSTVGPAGTGPSLARTQHSNPLPQWVHSISPDPAIDTGYSGCSDGFNIINNNCVHRQRRGGFETDGARWGAPLSKGKHVFEIYWPMAMRSTLATVGVGTDDAPLFVKPKDSLVGCNSHSWGLDIARRRVLHKGQQIVSVPKNGLVPDKFYMYVDCDSCTVGYGTDTIYYGAPIRFPKEKLPVYAMIGCMCENAQVTMIYRGSENRNAAPGNITTVVVPSQGPQGLQVTVVNPGTVQTVGAPEPAKY